MELLANLSSNQMYSNPLAVLLDVVKTELNYFKLAMISSHKLDPGEFQVTGFCNEHHCPVYTAEEMLNGSPNFPVLSGEFVESWKTNPNPMKISCDTCPDLFQGELKYFGNALVIPIWIRGRIERWIILVDYHSNSKRTDLEKLALLLNYALTNILRSEQKRQLDKARLWIDEELQEISRLQSLLLPHKDLQIEGVQLAFKFEAFKDAGGDYLDLFQLPSPEDEPNSIRWGGIIADVTGHGPSAAVEAAMVDAILRTFEGGEKTTPADATAYLNKNFFTRKDRGKFVTAMLFVYQSDTGMVRYVSAGHPNGYVKRGDQVIELNQSKGIPIGVLQDYQWEYKEFKLQKDDILFIYTDVVLETRNLSGEEFGDKRLVDTIASSPSCPDLLIDHIHDALFEFSGRSELKDDLTLSAIKLL
ncbi:MAG: serine/threonine-protein phosphatase [Kangiellaceae bacterium]|nr:serine/threonine-protein phosphatase [Kangiellaceae bacterium]